MFIFFTFLSFYRKINFSNYSNYAILQIFGFQPNATYDIKISNSKNKEVMVGLVTPREANTATGMIIDSKNFTCKMKPDLFPIQINRILSTNNGSGHFSGIISKYLYLSPMIVTCDPEGTSLDLELQFSNPHSFLDSRKIPCLYIKPIATAILGLILIFWVINWVLNFTLENRLHLYLTTTLLITFLYFIIDFFDLLHHHNSDDTTDLTKVSISFRCFHELLILTAMMMAAKGWCIIFDTISWFEIFIGVFFSIAYSIPIILVDSQVFNLYISFALFITGFFSCFFYYNILIDSVNNANSVVTAHLILISQSGIDPETTPIYEKFKMFRSISNAVIYYFSMMMVRTVLLELVEIPDYFMELIYDVATIALLAKTVWLFKLKKSFRSGYIMVGQNADSVEFSFEDFERMNDDGLTHPTTPWQEGMPLPAQPIVNKNGATLSRNNFSFFNHNNNNRNRNKETNEANDLNSLEELNGRENINENEKEEKDSDVEKNHKLNDLL